MEQKVTLQLNDVLDLYEFYKDRNPDEEYPHKTKREKLRYNRLRRLALLTEYGTLSQLRGMLAIEKLLEKVEIYRAGVPWDAYHEKRDEKTWKTSYIIRQMNHLPWMPVDVPGLRHYVMTKEIIVAGKVVRNKYKDQSMRLDPMIDKKDLDLFVVQKINEYDQHKEKWREIKPHTFCWDIFSKYECVWLTDKYQDTWIPIRGQYIKFAYNRFSKKIRFYMKDPDSFIAVVIPPIKRIRVYRYVAACILPLDETGIFKIPDRIDANWEEKFIDKKKRRLV